MKFLAAELEIDGNLQREVVVDVSPDGMVQSVTPLASLPCEPANTTYVAHLIVKRNQLLS
ncbi:MAG: hypothetical protein IKN59_05745 [Paludibacteraceae bacterium]|nr:hypothetical protein [Paludibacteraceae bacterium]